MTDTETLTAAMIALASEGYRWFETATRDDGASYVRTREDRPEWLSELIHAAHGDMFPDDWRYQFVRDALSAIDDASAGADSQEVCDEYSEPDIYTSQLTAWLASRADRHSYCDDAVSEGLIAENADMLARIGVGQYMEKREVFASVLSSLAERADELADDDGSDDES